MNYEAGLYELKQYAQETSWWIEFTIYEARLRENLEDEKLHGSSPQNTANRYPIIAQLNRLSQQHLNMSFNDLCVQKSSTSQHASSVESGPADERQASESEPLFNIFISYHEKDRRYLQELQTHLNQYVKRGRLRYWDKTQIMPGAQWAIETAKALHNATIAIILVSAYYLSSDEHITGELPELLSEEQHEGKRILCVIVRHCAFEDSDLAQFTPINNPDQPLSMISAAQREEIWRKLANLVKTS